MKYIFKEKWWPNHVKSILNYIYKINNGYKLIFYWKLRVYTKNQTFNLSDPVEKKLSRINGFYEVLSYTEETNLYKLYELAYYDNYGDIKDKENPSTRNLEWYWDMWDAYFQIMYNYEEEYDYKKWKDCIMVYYNEYRYWEHIQGLEKKSSYNEDVRYECYKKEEFNLLMQIYFWVYDDEKLKKELEDKEKKWEYDYIKKYVNDEMINKIFFEKEKKLTEEEKRKMEDYLKLQLLRKPTEWEFPELNIKKIYDKNWDEEEQRKVVEEINKELWEEVVIIE